MAVASKNQLQVLVKNHNGKSFHLSLKNGINSIVLHESAQIELINQENKTIDIVNVAQDGNHLVIQFDNATKLIIENYYEYSESSVSYVNHQGEHQPISFTQSQEAVIAEEVKKDDDDTLLPWLFGGIVAAGAGIALASSHKGSKSAPSLPPQNQAPTDIILSKNTITENESGVIIGKLETKDPNTKDTFTYKVNDDRFEIIDGNLKLKEGISIDYERESSINLIITSTDDKGLSIEKTVMINVLDINEQPVLTPIQPIQNPTNNITTPPAPSTKPNENNTTPANINHSPTDILLSNDSVKENIRGATIGKITVVDPDDNESFTYKVNDDRFEIIDGNLKLKEGISLDYEKDKEINIKITATDKSGASFEKELAVRIEDVNDEVKNDDPSLLDNKDNIFIAPEGSDQHFVINGMDGDDQLTTGRLIDIVRGGTGKDEVYTGAANDAVVIVGVTKGIDYKLSDITNAGGSGYNLSRVLTLDEMKEKTVSDIVAGEKYDGQDGNNTLITYGYTDLTQVELNNFLFIRAESGTIKINVEQLISLNPRIISSDNANLILTSNSKPAVIDLSKTNVHLFKSITVDEGITLIIRERSIDETMYLGGKGKIQIIPSVEDEIPDLTGKHISVSVIDEQGNEITAEQHKGSVVEGNLVIGTADSEEIIGTDQNDRILGNEGDDVISGGKGDDILRGGKGSNTLDGGEGDDKFIIVGNLSAGGKINNDADNAVLGFSIESLNGKDWGEADQKQIIRGGEGHDTLYVIGTADISGFDITGIEKIEIRSDVTFSADQVSQAEISGDGSSIIRIRANEDSNFLSSTSGFKMNNIRQIHLEKGVVLEVKNPSELGGALILTGEGTIRFTEPVGNLGEEYTITNGIKIEDVNGDVNLDSVRKLNLIEYASAPKENVDETINDDTPLWEKLQDAVNQNFVDRKLPFKLEGGDGDDYIEGSQYNDFIDGKEGNDILSGKEGSDIFSISNSQFAKKTIIDKNNDEDPKSRDTLYLGNAKGAAEINLAEFNGVIGIRNAEGNIEYPITEIQVGASDTGGIAKAVTSKTNILLIIDRSGSMDRDGRMEKAKQASLKLLEKYSQQGDIAVRVLAFDSYKYHKFNGFDGWMNKTEAIKAIKSIYASGGTNYYIALDGAEEIFTENQGDVYYPNGSNVSFFLSDGEPYERLSAARQEQWENFTRDHKIQSYAIGFGGLNSTDALEAIAYDGKNNQEIKAILETDIDQLGETITKLAKVDFIENVIGTEFNDKIIGNSLDNYLDGGDGDDILQGMGGNNFLRGGKGIDTAKFEGESNQYEISYKGNNGFIKNKISGKVDTIDRTVEKLEFSDKTMDVEFPKLEGINDPFPNVLMSKFANAVYLTDSGADDLKELKNNDWTFLDSRDFDYKNNSKYTDLSQYFGNNGNITPYFEFGGKTLKDGAIISAHSDGLVHKTYSKQEVEQDSSLEGKTKEGTPIDGSSAALVAVKGDTLVISFRGTEDPTIWEDNLPKNPEQYSSVAPIIRQIVNEVFSLQGITSPSDKNYRDAVNYIKDFAKSSDSVTKAPFSWAADNPWKAAIGGVVVAIATAISPSTVLNLTANALLLIDKLSEYELIRLAKLPINKYVDTDSTGWINPEKHYQGYAELLSNVKNYVTENKEIKKIFVTGHSLGGAMSAWFMADKINGAKAEEYKDIDISIIPFAAPGIVSKKFYHELNNVKMIRLEAVNDVVPDTTDIVAQAQDDMNNANPLKYGLKISQLGEQYNVMTHSILEFSGKVAGEIHAMKNNYFTAVNLLEDVGFNSDLNFIRHNTNVIRKNTKGVHYSHSDYKNSLESYDPIIMRHVENINVSMQKAQEILGKDKYYFNVYKNESADITGDEGELLGKRDFVVAEHYSENDVIIGTHNNDILIGDADFVNKGKGWYEAGWNGTNDIFYVGRGRDTVYGDQTGDDDGGIDTVVYNFKDTYLFQESQSLIHSDSHKRFPSIKIGDVFNHAEKGMNAMLDLNDIKIRIDEGEDTLYDIEQLHFIDKPSNETNLLAGSSGDDRINGLGGNDFLFGADGHDIFYEGLNSGNDRIHGGRGNDSVYYHNVNIKENGIRIKNLSLEVQLEDGAVDHLYSIESISANGISQSTKDWLNLSDQKLLETYSPIFNYSGDDNDKLRVFGKVVKDASGKITGLDYELREYDPVLDDSWWVHIALGDDLLPTYFYTELSGFNEKDDVPLMDHVVQIRNAFDTSLTFSGNDGNHVNIYLNIDKAGAYLEKPKDMPDNLTRVHISNVEMSDIRNNAWDFADHKSGSSNNYEQSSTPKLAGLPSGQMEMGFLFQNTNAAKLGHFDLLGEPMNHGII